MIITSTLSDAVKITVIDKSDKTLENIDDIVKQRYFKILN